MRDTAQGGSQSAALEGEQPLPPGAPVEIGPWTLRSLLGRGGMAAVYRATRTRDGQEVALKVMDASRRPAEADAMRERFGREIAILKRLSHPGLVKILDHGEDRAGARPLTWYAMPLIRGLTAHQLLLRRGRLWLSEAVRVAHDAAAALAEPHQQGIVHRDIKPSNVFVTSDEQVVVADFGVALLPDATTLTGQGRVWGTLAFLAPEQLVGERARPPSDVFALAALLFSLATGRLLRDPDAPPWSQSTPEPTDRLAEMPDLPTGLARVLRGALDADPVARPPHGGALADALAPFAGAVPRPLPAPRRPEHDEVRREGTQLTRLPAPIPYAAAALTDELGIPAEERTTDEQAVPVPAGRPDVFRGPCHLVQRDGAGRGRIFRLASDHVVVGREPGSDVELEDASVSARHGLLRREAGRWEVVDGGSTNGIRVNGIGVPGAVLHDGDEVQVGRVRLVFVGSGRDVEQARAALLPPTAAVRDTVGPRNAVRPAPPGFLAPWDAALLAGVAAALGAVLGWLLAR
ncbi:MAG: protein kinase [Deltaproteobacteria bacterium]|nr:protein kinase [Deltaproteobacteria bacterium]